jgi:hypothetical protein
MDEERTQLRGRAWQSGRFDPLYSYAIRPREGYAARVILDGGLSTPNKTVA